MVMQDAIVGVNEGLLKSCHKCIQAIWYDPRELSIVTTTVSTELYILVGTKAMSIFSPCSPRLDSVAEIYSRAGTCEDDNNLPKEHDTRPLEWLPMCSQKAFVMAVVSDLSGI
jgi:hypothetical protein